jgi:hypothetical protein
MNKRPAIGRVRRWTWLNGEQRTPGVSLWKGGKLIAHMTPSEAYQLANKIVDETEKIEHRKDTKSVTNISNKLGQPVTINIPGELIEDAQGNPLGATLGKETTAEFAGMIVTQSEADTMGIDWNTPGLTVVDDHDGEIIQRNAL